MQFQFSFKHMETSEALQSYAEAKVQDKVKKYVTKPIDAHLSFRVDKQGHKAQCSLRGGDGFSLEVSHTGEDMYASVDLMIDKLDAKLKKHKERLKNHKPNKTLRHLKIVNPDVETVDAEDILKYEQARRKAYG